MYSGLFCAHRRNKPRKKEKNSEKIWVRVQIGDEQTVHFLRRSWWNTEPKSEGGDSPGDRRRRRRRSFFSGRVPRPITVYLALAAPAPTELREWTNRLVKEEGRNCSRQCSGVHGYTRRVYARSSLIIEFYPFLFFFKMASCFFFSSNFEVKLPHLYYLLLFIFHKKL